MKTKGRACIALYSDEQCTVGLARGTNGYIIDVLDYKTLTGGATPIELYAKNIGTHVAHYVEIGKPINKTFNFVNPGEVKQCSFILQLAELERNTAILEVDLSYDSIKHRR